MNVEQKISGPPRQAEAGHGVYSKTVLAVYDWLVLGLSNRFIWRCPTSQILDWYDRHVTANHLDVGVGTGYFLNRCRFPADRPRLVLMDLNPNCLAVSARRLQRYTPMTVIRNLLEPISFDGPGFNSVGLNYVLHCLPGRMQDKGIVFEHLAPLINPEAVVFGSTLLSRGIDRSVAARRLMRLYNRKGIFANSEDSRDGLRDVLQRHFSHVRVETVGCVALFRAQK